MNMEHIDPQPGCSKHIREAEIIRQMTCDQFANNTDVKDCLIKYFTNMNLPEKDLKATLDDISSYIKEAYESFIKRPYYKRALRNLQITSMDWLNDKKIPEKSVDQPPNCVSKSGPMSKKAAGQLIQSSSKPGPMSKKSVARLPPPSKPSKPCPLSKKPKVTSSQQATAIAGNKAETVSKELMVYDILDSLSPAPRRPVTRLRKKQLGSEKSSREVSEISGSIEEDRNLVELGSSVAVQEEENQGRTKNMGHKDPQPGCSKRIREAEIISQMTCDQFVKNLNVKSMSKNPAGRSGQCSSKPGPMSKKSVAQLPPSSKPPKPCPLSKKRKITSSQLATAIAANRAETFSKEFMVYDILDTPSPKPRRPKRRKLASAVIESGSESTEEDRNSVELGSCWLPVVLQEEKNQDQRTDDEFIDASLNEMAADISKRTLRRIIQNSISSLEKLSRTSTTSPFQISMKDLSYNDYFRFTNIEDLARQQIDDFNLSLEEKSEAIREIAFGFFACLCQSDRFSSLLKFKNENVRTFNEFFQMKSETMRQESNWIASNNDDNNNIDDSMNIINDRNQSLSMQSNNNDLTGADVVISSDSIEDVAKSSPILLSASSRIESGKATEEINVGEVVAIELPKEAEMENSQKSPTKQLKLPIPISLQHTISLDDFRKYTNIEEILIDRYKKRNQSFSEKEISNNIEKCYNSLEKLTELYGRLPPSIRFKDNSIQNLDDFMRMKEQSVDKDVLPSSNSCASNSELIVLPVESALQKEQPTVENSFVIDPSPKTNSQLLNHDETYIRAISNSVADDKENQNVNVINDISKTNPVCENGENGSKPSSPPPLAQQANIIRPFNNRIENPPKPMPDMYYISLTYLSLERVYISADINKLHYNAGIPIFEQAKAGDLIVEARIKLDEKFSPVISIYGDTVKMIFGFNTAEWNCIVELVKIVKTFEYLPDDPEPNDKSLVHQILYYLFKTMPLFSRVTLELNRCDNTKVACVKRVLSYSKPRKRLSDALSPLILGKMKTVNLNLN